MLLDKLNSCKRPNIEKEYSRLVTLVIGIFKQLYYCFDH